MRIWEMLPSAATRASSFQVPSGARLTAGLNEPQNSRGSDRSGDMITLSRETA